jgi:hypothetical protein
MWVDAIARSCSHTRTVGFAARPRFTLTQPLSVRLGRLFLVNHRHEVRSVQQNERRQAERLTGAGIAC